MTAQLTARRVEAAGAELYVEVRGSGPLLLVVGQPMTSEPFGPLADALADRYTVATYDPRGVGRSTVTDRELPVTPEVEGDDLARIIETLGGGPADVFGSSGGAVAGLALAARRPELVRVLVAHEPPVTEMLPDAVNVRRVVDGIVEEYRTSGAPAAWGQFVSLVMHDGLVGPDGVAPAAWPPPGAPDGAPDHDAAGAQDQGGGGDPAGGPDQAGGEHDAGSAPDLTSGAAEPETSVDQAADDEMFFLRMLQPFTRWVPDVEVLRGGEPRVVVAVGEESREEIACRSAEAVAAQLGTSPVTFPGGHAGFMGDATPFADTLRRVLDETV